MESTETIENKPLSVEEAVQGILAPQTDDTTETVEDELQTTEEETVEATDELAETEELTADAETEEIEYSDETDDIELSAEDETDNDYEEEAATEDDSDLISVKVNGQIENVSLEELKQGYSGQKYVQQGMQEAANQRKEAEAVYQALQNDRQQVQQLLQQMQSGQFARQPEAPSKALFEDDPIGYMEEKMKYDEAMETYNKQMSEVQAIAQQQSQAQQQAQQTYLRKEMEELQKVMPEFADPKKAKTVKEKLITNGSNYYGYTPEEIGTVMDHRAIRVLHDAIKYREIMEGKESAVKKTNKKRVVKAGAKKVDDSTKKVRQKQMAKLKQTGKIDDAISLMFK
jgi:hypothetical protein